jgi:hypothetical protein
MRNIFPNTNDNLIKYYYMIYARDAIGGRVVSAVVVISTRHRRENITEIPP